MPNGTLAGTLEEKILSVIRKSPHITQSEIASKIECSERKVKRIMKAMIDKGMIERVGGRKWGNGLKSRETDQEILNWEFGNEIDDYSAKYLIS